jgi:hypothetical protein
MEMDSMIKRTTKTTASSKPMAAKRVEPTGSRFAHLANLVPQPRPAPTPQATAKSLAAGVLAALDLVHGQRR